MRVFPSIRNHGGVPAIEEDVFELEIGGLVNNPTKISMKDLKDPSKFPYVVLNLLWAVKLNGYNNRYY